jgi:hypothetical protein
VTAGRTDKHHRFLHTTIFQRIASNTMLLILEKSSDRVD